MSEKPEQRPENKPENKIEQSNTGIRVLIIDDDPHIVESVSTYLELEGYVSLSAFSGPEGLEIALKENPHIIVLDIMMPEMDGFQVMDKIKANENLRQIPVIMLTAKGSDKDVMLGWRSGVANYITKPFDLEELVHAIELVMAGHHHLSPKKVYEV